MCKHGFIVRDIQGDTRFLCKECDKRFSRYPQKGDGAETMSLEFKWDMLQNALKEFEGGFVERINKPTYSYTTGVYVNPTITYNLPVADKITQTVNFIPNRDLGKIDD